jgi:hypothetical protein
MLHVDRLWADLLSSMPLCFNLFGDLFGNAEYTTRVVRAWWPDAPHGAVTVRLEHSPARCDPSLLGSKNAFDVAFEIDMGGEDRAIIGVETQSTSTRRLSRAPGTKARRRYVAVAERSVAFVDVWRELVIGAELQQIWLDHLLVLAMLQHSSARCRRVGSYSSTRPPIRVSRARLAPTKRWLRDPATFQARTIEDILATRDAVDVATVMAFRERYFL